MARRNDGVLEILIFLPWRVSVVVATIAYIALAFVIPSIPMEGHLLQAAVTGLAQLAPYFALVLLIPAPLSAINSWRKRQLLDKQTGINSIRALGWKEFEELVAEAYRRKGYSVIENYKAGADGGIDIRLQKDGLTHLVQCKQWKARSVGVSVVREMYGVMTAEGASSVIVIISGAFTQEAKNFAAGKPIVLIDGSQLEPLIGRGQSTDKLTSSQSSMNSSQSQCPSCGSELVLRKAKKGMNAGNQFYGCSSFPRCRYTKQIIN